MKFIYSFDSHEQTIYATNHIMSISLFEFYYTFRK